MVEETLDGLRQALRFALIIEGKDSVKNKLLYEFCNISTTELILRKAEVFMGVVNVV